MTALSPDLTKRIAAVGKLLFELDLATAAKLAGAHDEHFDPAVPLVVGSMFEDRAIATKRKDWIFGKTTAARAARANAERKDDKRFISFKTLSDGERSFVLVTPAQKKALSKLLEVDPELPPLPIASDAKALGRALTALGEIADPEVEWGKRVTIRISVDAAKALEEFLDWPRS